MKLLPLQYRLKALFAVSLLLLLFAPAQAAFAQTKKPTLIVMQFAGDAALDPAVIRQINEIFESTIITTNYFSITDRDSVLDYLAQSGIVAENLASDDAINLARNVKADFIILGSVTRTGTGVYTINPRILASDTGREVYSRSISFSADIMLKALEELATKIVVAVRQRTDVTLSQVDALVQIKDWQSAGYYLDLYAKVHPEDSEQQRIESYRGIISKALGEQYFADAKRSLDLNLYEAARNAIGLAQKYEPDNRTYKDFSYLIEQQYAAMRQQTDDEVFAKLDELRIRAQWETGLALIAYLESKSSRNPKITAYKEEFANKAQARLYYTQAKNSYMAGDFSAAVLSIEKAIELYPDNTEYQKFRAKVSERAERDAKSRAEWGRYMEEARAFSTTELFLLYRPNVSNVFVALDFPTISVSPASSISMEVDKGGHVSLGPQFGAGVWYRGPITGDYQLASYLSVGAGWYGGLNFAYALKEEAEGVLYSGSYYTLNQLGLFYFDVFGGADVRFTMYGFSLFAGLELAPSLYTLTYQRTVPYLGETESTREPLAAFTGGYRLMLSWNITQSSQIFLLLNSRTPLHTVRSSLIVGETRLSLQAGYSFFIGAVNERTLSARLAACCAHAWRNLGTHCPG